jgi:hypothetical protein
MSVTVDNSGNASPLTNYSVRVDLGTGFDFTHAQSAGEDVRFTAADGITLLDYWIEFWDNVGDTAIVWVEVPSVPASSTVDVLMYYGNGAAADAADGDATFEFFDDFEVAAPASSKWADWERVVIDGSLNGSHNIMPEDIDGDLKPDLVVTAYVAENIAWYQQPTDPINDAWTRYVIDPVLENAHDLKIGDIDGDLKNDVVGLSLSSTYADYSSSPGYLCWYQHPIDPTTSGAWQKTVIQSSGAGGLLGARSCMLEDIDSDGDLDIAVAVDRSPGLLVWYENPGGVVADSTWNEHILDNTQGTGADVACADIDGDGEPDLVYAGNGSSLYVYFAPADPTNVPGWTRVALTGRAYHVDVVDFDGDGDLDILRAGGTANLVSWLENPKFGGSPSDPRVPANWNEYIIENNASIAVANRVQAADIDNDGDLDIGMDADPSGGTGTFKWYRRPADPTNVGAWEIYVIDDTPAYTAYAHDSYLADINLDGTVDMVGVAPSAQTVMLWINDSTTVESAVGPDPAKWTDGGATVTAGVLTVNSTGAFARSIPQFGFKAMRTRARWASYDQYGDIGFIDDGIAVGENDAMFTVGWDGSPFNEVTSISSDATNFEFGPGYSIDEGTDWKTWEIKRQSTQVDFVVNDTVRATPTTYVSQDPLHAQINSYTPGNPDIKSDWVLVRNYSVPEPAATTGAEVEEPPAVPVLANPADASTVTALAPTFDWSATADPGGSYTLEYASDASFTTAVVTITGLSSNSYALAPGELANGTYYWHVEAFNATGPGSGYQTTPFSFVMDAPPLTETWVDDDYCDVCANDGHLWGYDAFATIQEGIDAVDGSTVNVAAGTYVEQLDIGKAITLRGAGATTVIQAPTVLAAKFTTSSDNKPIIYIHDVAGVTIENLVVDGAGNGNANSKFEGIAFHNAGGTLDSLEVKDVRDTPFSGAQHGVAIYAWCDDLTPRMITVSNCNVHDFQKNAFALNADATTPLVVNVHDNVVTGYGPTTVTAQNGVQVWADQGSGEIRDNVITGIAYDNTAATTKWVATSILNYYGDVDIKGNTVSNAHVGVYNIDGAGAIDSNDITIEKIGVYAFGIIATDPPRAVPAGYDADFVSGTSARQTTQTADAAALLTVTSNDNTVVFSGVDNTATYGIEADAGWGPNDLDFTADGNTVTGFEVGIEIYQCESGCAAGVFTSVSATGNNLAANTIGMRSNVTYLTPVAEGNYWGDIFCTPVTAQVVGDVDFDPWCNDDFSFCTFTCNVTDVWVDDDYCDTCANDGHFWGYDAFATIQEGIDEVVGSTVHVAPGTYIETLSITKDNLQLLGADKTTVIIQGATGVATNNAGIYIADGVSGVTLSGFTLVGVNPASTPRYGIKVGQADGCTLEDLLIYNVYRAGIDAHGSTNLLVRDVESRDNFGTGMQTTDANDVTFNNITTSNNPWGGVGIFTWGEFAPLGTSGIVFTGTNSFGETGSAVGGLYLEEGNFAVPASPEPITYSTEILDAADVTVQLADFTHTLHGNSDNSNNYVRFYGTLTDAENAAAGVVSHILDDRYIMELAGINLYVPTNLGGIQAAIDAATAGDIVNIAAGIFTEQVECGKDLTLRGLGAGTVILSPNVLATKFTTSGDNKPIVYIHDADVTVKSLVVDGAGKGNANNRFEGIAFRNAGGTVDSVEVTGVRDTPFSGVQHGVGIYAWNDDVTPRTITVSDCVIEDFQKNAFALNADVSSPLTVDVRNNMVVGFGPTDITAQNGIQVSANLGTGTIADNMITGIAYDNTAAVTKWVATSILNFYATLDITGNTITNGHMGVYNYDGAGTVSGNDITIEKIGVYAFGIIASDPPKAVPSGFEPDFGGSVARKATGEATAAALLTVAVDGNTVDFEGPDNTATYGIEADAGWGPNDLAFSATGNTVTDFEVGFEIYACESSCAAGVFTALSATGNSIINNTIGMRSNVTYLTTDALGNYWGFDDCFSIQPLVVGDIDYDPWCNFDFTSCLLSCSASEVWVDDDYCPTCTNDGHLWGYDAFDVIQDGIDAVVGSIVHILPGTYMETLNITKDNLELLGVDKTTVIIQGVAGQATNNAGIYVADGVTNATLSGFTLIGVSPSSVPRYGIKLGQADGCTLSDLLVHTVFRTGIDLLGTSNLTVTDVESRDNGGNGMQATDCNGIDFSNITTSNNAWGGVGIFTWGRYTPLGTSGIVISGTNSFGETAADVGGLYLEEGNYNDPPNPEPITYSSNILDGADVTVQLADFTHTLHGDSDNDNVYTRFYATLTDAQNAAAGAVSHILGNRYIVEIDGATLYVPANLGAIQAAIDAANPGDLINIDPATFVEQLDIGKPVTLLGAGPTTVVEAPALLDVKFTTSAGNKPIVYIHDVLNATVKNLVVDGAGKGNANVRFEGVAFHNAGGTLDSLEVIGVRDTPFSGSQHGVAIYSWTDDLIARKNAFALNADAASPLVVNVHDNVITGAGATDVTAQNGVQVWADLGVGQIANNVITGIAYDNTAATTKWVASSILNYFSDVDIIGNTVSQGHVGVYNYDGSSTIRGNDITIEKIGVYAFGIIASDPPKAVPAGFDVDLEAVAQSRSLARAAQSAAVLTVLVDSNTVDFTGPDNTATYGIDAEAGWGPDDLDFTALDNTVTDFEIGFEIFACESSCDVGVFTALSATGNTIVGNTIGMQSNVGYLTTQAEGNYWGTIACAAVTAQVVGDVDYDPWCNSDFSVCDLSCVAPAVPVLLTPLDDTTITTNSPTFTWTATAGETGTYTLEYSTDSLFTTSLVVPGLDTNAHTVGVPLADSGEYFWRVEAFNFESLASGYQTSPFSFTVNSLAPSIPFLLYPPHASYTTLEHPTFVWVSAQSIASATRRGSNVGMDLATVEEITYTLQYGTDSTFATATTVTDIPDTFYTVPVTSPLGFDTWFWRVEAVDEAGNGSGYQSFPYWFATFLKGDQNWDFSVSSADLIVLVNHIFKGGPEPQPCSAAGDVNCDGTLTSADIIFLVNYVFKSGTPPCEIGDLIAAGTWDCP